MVAGSTSSSSCGALSPGAVRWARRHNRLTAGVLNGRSGCSGCSGCNGWLLNQVVAEPGVLNGRSGCSGCSGRLLNQRAVAEPGVLNGCSECSGCSGCSGWLLNQRVVAEYTLAFLFIRITGAVGVGCPAGPRFTSICGILGQEGP
eukprot:1180917-Prorocentrum_minimum.AAC.2